MTDPSIHDQAARHLRARVVHSSLMDYAHQYPPEICDLILDGHGCRTSDGVGPAFARGDLRLRWTRDTDEAPQVLIEARTPEGYLVVMGLDPLLLLLDPVAVGEWADVELLAGLAEILDGET